MSGRILGRVALVTILGLAWSAQAVGQQPLGVSTMPLLCPGPPESAPGSSPVSAAVSVAPRQLARCGLGVRWDVIEGCWLGSYTRRGGSDTFSGQWSLPDGRSFTADVRIRINGATVSIQRTNSTMGDDCVLRDGQLAPDGVTVTGTFQCGQGFGCLYATIRCGDPVSGPSLAGTWYRSADPNLPASIAQSGGALSFTNEFGMTSGGSFVDATTVVAADWGGLYGTISGDGNRIDWANGTWWSRIPGGGSPPQMPNLAGTWYRSGDRSKPASIGQSGDSLTFTNEFGMVSAGVFESGTVVVATGWEGGLRGTISADGRRIDWANGTWWGR